MNKPAFIDVPVDAATLETIDRVAAELGRSRESFAAIALKRVAVDQDKFLASIREGIAQLDRGEGIPHEVVMAELDAMIARHEARCRN